MQQAAPAAPSPAAATIAAGYPTITVENQSWGEIQIYLLYRFDATKHNPIDCLTVPQPGVCQQYLALAPGTIAAGVHPAIDPVAYVFLEDNDALPLPVGYTDGNALEYATVEDEPCASGSENCLPKFKVGIGCWVGA